jgi:hypothetical protein
MMRPFNILLFVVICQNGRECDVKLISYILFM